MNPPDSLAVLRALPSAAALVSSDGKILFVNELAREQLSLKSERPEESLVALVNDESRKALREYLVMCARSTTPIPGAFTVQRPSASRYRCKGGLIAPRSASDPAMLLLRFEEQEPGNPFILLSQTVAGLTEEVKRRRDAETALRRAQVELQAKVLEAENANRLKDEFLATLSHELRTPLSAILGWTSVIRERSVPEERRRRGMEVIDRNARIQLQLIEQLLDVSRIISGKLLLDIKPFDPIQIVQAAVESMRPAAELKGMQLETSFDPQAGLMYGDPDRLHQVFWNLISNAVKFTPQGGRIRIRLERVNSTVELSVVDTGKGIAPDFLPYVFERFRQQESTTIRSHGGLGLGLAIAKSLVELHGGTIRVHSDGDGTGASFIVCLPQTRLEATPDPRTLAPPSLPLAMPSELDGLRILAVDDDADTLELIGVWLQQHGAEVKSARTAEDAFWLVKSWRPELLLSDIGMPGQDGYTLMRRVRALPAHEGGGTLSIALTAFAGGEDRSRALDAGFQSHVPKPVEFADLLAVITSLVGRSSSHQGSKSAIGYKQGEPAEPPK